MSARRQIIAALSEDSLGGIATLQDVAHAEQLVNALVAEVLAEAPGPENYPGELAMLRGLLGALRVTAKHGAFHEVQQLLTEHERDEQDAYAELGEKATATAATATPDLTIYRASHDSIVMGLYTTAAAARAHCEAEERRAWAAFEGPTFDWIEDEEDGVAEMTVWIGGEECTRGYVVTPLEVASEYDEEADE